MQRQCCLLTRTKTTATLYCPIFSDLRVLFLSPCGTISFFLPILLLLCPFTPPPLSRLPACLNQFALEILVAAFFSLYEVQQVSPNFLLQDALKKMEDYTRIPAHRLAMLVKKYAHQRTMQNIQGAVCQHWPNIFPSSQQLCRLQRKQNATRI